MIEMNCESQCEKELSALQSLCDATATTEERRKLMEQFQKCLFVDPEHQVVFESIRALSRRGPITLTNLRIHLNNRGFPDTDLEKYFQPAQSERGRNLKGGNIS